MEISIDLTIQATWSTEAKKRRDEVREDAVQSIPGEEALAQVKTVTQAMRYAFHPEALTEYAEAVQYYMEQRVEIAQAFY